MPTIDTAPEMLGPIGPHARAARATASMHEQCIADEVLLQRPNAEILPLADVTWNINRLPDHRITIESFDDRPTAMHDAIMIALMLRAHGAVVAWREPATRTPGYDYWLAIAGRILAYKLG